MRASSGGHGQHATRRQLGDRSEVAQVLGKYQVPTTPTPRWARVCPKLVVEVLLIVCVGDFKLDEWRWR